MLVHAETPTPFRPLAKDELLRRPLESGFAIDPSNAHEIDDAVSVEPINKNKGYYRIKIHVADAGLLLESPAVHGARRIGWSEYYDDGTALTMLPAEIALAGLSLNVNHHETGTAPAVTIATSFSSKDRSFHEIEIYKSRLACVAMDYREFDDAYRKKEPEIRIISNRAALLTAEPQKRASIDPSRRGKDVVGHFMIAANLLVARQMYRQHLPWLFRNHHINTRHHDMSNLLLQLYPDSDLFTQNNLAWYGRIPTTHDGLNRTRYCHFTSPLRRFPDLANHLTLHASMLDLPLPYSEQDLDDVANEMGEKIKHGLGHKSVA